MSAFACAATLHSRFHVYFNFKVVFAIDVLASMWLSEYYWNQFSGRIFEILYLHSASSATETQFRSKLQLLSFQILFQIASRRRKANSSIRSLYDKIQSKPRSSLIKTHYLLIFRITSHIYRLHSKQKWFIIYIIKMNVTVECYIVVYIDKIDPYQSKVHK